MPTPRKYQNQAEKQKAYRERQKQAQPSPTITVNMAGTKWWRSTIESTKKQLEMVRDEMEEHAGKRSDNWKDSEKGEEHQTRLDSIEAAIAELEGIEF